MRQELLYGAQMSGDPIKAEWNWGNVTVRHLIFIAFNENVN